MRKLTVEIRTDENGYLSKTLLLEPSLAPGASLHLSVTMLTPFATALWGALDVDSRDGPPSRQPQPFVLWHSETVQLGPWPLDGGAKILVISGKTKPARAHGRVVLEIASPAYEVSRRSS